MALSKPNELSDTKKQIYRQKGSPLIACDKQFRRLKKREEAAPGLPLHDYNDSTDAC